MPLKFFKTAYQYLYNAQLLNLSGSPTENQSMPDFLRLEYSFKKYKSSFFLSSC